MSCGSEFETESVIIDTLLAIVEAQDRVDSGINGPVGCSRAIQELIGGINPSGFNTIPVILTWKTGVPFVGYGALRENVTPSTSSIVYSAIFRVEEVDPDTGAASLELLTRTGVIPYIPDTPVINPNEALFELNNEVLAGTGAYINVDLNCVCAVTCLPPTTIL